MATGGCPFTTISGPWGGPAGRWSGPAVTPQAQDLTVHESAHRASQLSNQSTLLLTKFTRPAPVQPTRLAAASSGPQPPMLARFFRRRRQCDDARRHAGLLSTAAFRYLLQHGAPGPTWGTVSSCPLPAAPGAPVQGARLNFKALPLNRPRSSQAA